MLSPSQCPAYFPLDGYVDLDMTIPRFFVNSDNALNLHKVRLFYSAVLAFLKFLALPNLNQALFFFKETILFRRFWVATLILKISLINLQLYDISINVNST